MEATPHKDGAGSKSGSPRVWVVRAGRGAVHADRFLADGVVAIGFGVMESIAHLTWEDVSGRIRKAMPDDPPVTIGLAAGALFRFANEFSANDFVVTPEPGGTMLSGQIVGEYQFVDSPLVEDHSHVRTVRWFGRFPRAQLSDGARKSIGSLMTLFLPGFQDELLGIVRPLSAAAVPPSPRPARAPQKATAAVPVTASIPTDLATPPGPTGSKFETDKVDLLYLLEQIGNRDLAVPDFQRSFVWDASATRELVVSIIRAFPAGNLLFLRGGSAVFLPRSVEEAPGLNGHEAAALVLDGQQRLSSLFHAFSGLGTHRFFVDITALMSGEDIDAAVKTFSAARAKPWADVAGQARSLMFPLARVRDYSYWRDDILDARASDDVDTRKRLRSYLNAVETAVIAPIRAYQFPVTTLTQDTPTEAVCTIFETLNRTGIKLSVFELICARAFAGGHRLRERWKQALSDYPVLDEFDIDPYYVLQTIALRVGKKPQRGVVASMDVPTIVAEWDASVRGMAQGLVMLRDQCGVLSPKWLPYAPMLPTLAAAWQDVDEAHGPAVGARRLKLQRWFWCASFVGDYDNAPNSRAEADIPLLHTWLTGGDAPRVVRDFRFEPATWLEVTGRQRGLYRATMALLMLDKPLDFHHAVPLTRTVIESTAVDDHHIFPAAYLKDQGATKQVDTVLNHTLIDKLTNIRIGKKAPSVYLAEMEAELRDALPGVLRSHGLPPDKNGPLWTDDYDSFLEYRLAHLTEALTVETQGPKTGEML